MEPKNLFFIVLLGTILITRLFLYFKPISAPTLKGFRIHHYHYGIVLLVISIAIKSLLVYAIGLGLFIDELTFILISGKDHKDNYSKESLIGTLVFIIVIFVSREKLMTFF